MDTWSASRFPAAIAFFGTTAVGLLLTLAWHELRGNSEPTTSPARLVAFLGSMFAASAAMITVAALDEAGKNAWCREHGVFPADLDQWRLNATTALAEPEEARASPQSTRQDKKRIKELERELLRKDRALAETAALLVLSKKVAAIFNKGEAE